MASGKENKMKKKSERIQAKYFNKERKSYGEQTFLTMSAYALK